MLKLIKRTVVLVLAVVLVYGMTVCIDKHSLQDGVLRLHVVANSDSAEDQQIKLLVRDAIVQALESDMSRVGTKEQAQALVSGKLKDLEQVANSTLEQAGVSHRATVTLDREAFSLRHYDTFTLPSGVYDSLRVTIGQGQGKNWWCVVFPSLCMTAASAEAEDVAAGAGFSDGLSGAISGRKEYRVRFFLLDCLGKIENYFAK